MAIKGSKRPTGEPSPDRQPTLEGGHRNLFEWTTEDVHQWQRNISERYLTERSYYEPCEIGALMAYPKTGFGAIQIDEDVLTYEELVSNEEELGGKWKRKSFLTLGDAWRAHFVDPQENYDDWRCQWFACTTRVQQAILREDLPCEKELVYLFHAILWMHGYGYEVPAEWLEKAKKDVSANPERYERPPQAHPAPCGNSDGNADRGNVADGGENRTISRTKLYRDVENLGYPASHARVKVCRGIEYGQLSCEDGLIDESIAKKWLEELPHYKPRL